MGSVVKWKISKEKQRLRVRQREDMTNGLAVSRSSWLWQQCCPLLLRHLSGEERWLMGRPLWSSKSGKSLVKTEQLYKLPKHKQSYPIISWPFQTISCSACQNMAGVIDKTYKKSLSSSSPTVCRFNLWHNCCKMIMLSTEYHLLAKVGSIACILHGEYNPDYHFGL